LEKIKYKDTQQFNKLILFTKHLLKTLRIEVFGNDVNSSIAPTDRFCRKAMEIALMFYWLLVSARRLCLYPYYALCGLNSADPHYGGTISKTY